MLLKSLLPKTIVHRSALGLGAGVRRGVCPFPLLPACLGCPAPPLPWQASILRSNLEGHTQSIAPLSSWSSSLGQHSNLVSCTPKTSQCSALPDPTQEHGNAWTENMEESSSTHSCSHTLVWSMKCHCVPRDPKSSSRCLLALQAAAVTSMDQSPPQACALAGQAQGRAHHMGQP